MYPNIINVVFTFAMSAFNLKSKGQIILVVMGNKDMITSY